MLVVKNLPANAGDVNVSSIPGLGRTPGEEHCNPLQYSCLENPRDRGAWRAMVYRAAKSWTQLKWLSTAREILNALNMRNGSTLSYTFAKSFFLNLFHLFTLELLNVYFSQDNTFLVHRSVWLRVGRLISVLWGWSFPNPITVTPFPLQVTGLGIHV